MRFNKAQRTGLADLFEKISTGLVLVMFFLVFTNETFSWLKIVLICTLSIVFIIRSVCLRGPDKESNDN